MIYKYFNLDTDPLMAGVDDSLMLMLDSAHEISTAILPYVKYIITSGKRNPGDNSVLKGAVPDSAHLSGLAVDLFVAGDTEFAAMMIGLVKAGFQRYGFYYVADTNPNNFIPKHIHVDRDPSKPTPCIWTKKEQN